MVRPVFLSELISQHLKRFVVLRGNARHFLDPRHDFDGRRMRLAVARAPGVLRRPTLRNDLRLLSIFIYRPLVRRPRELGRHRREDVPTIFFRDEVGQSRDPGPVRNIF